MAQLTDVQTNILNQLTQTDNGYARLKAMVGAENFMYSGHEDLPPDNISFKFKGSRLASHVKITINHYDLYDLEFTKQRGFDVYDVANFENAFAEDLRDIFEDVTGLHLQL